MEKIRKYVDKFFKTTKRNIRYMINTDECEEIVKTIKSCDGWDAISAVCKTFDYGYAKGYRAAKMLLMALSVEQKGGTAV